MSTRATLHAGLLWAIWLVLATYVTGLALHGIGLGPVWKSWFGTAVHNWLNLLTAWLPVAVCYVAAYRVGFRRPEVLLAAAAMTAYATGCILVIWAQVTTGLVPFPSIGDGVYLLFFPFIMAALVVTVRRHVRALAVSVWLDCALGSLGAAAVLAVVLNPVLESATTGSPSLASAVALAYPILDLLLVAAVAGIAALGDVRLGNRWGLLIAGMMVFAASDIGYALQVTAGTYVVGMPLDAGYSIGPRPGCDVGRRRYPTRPAGEAGRETSEWWEGRDRLDGGHNRRSGGAGRGHPGAPVEAGGCPGRGDAARGGGSLPDGVSPSLADGEPSPDGCRHRPADRVAEPAGLVCRGAGPHGRTTVSAPGSADAGPEQVQGGQRQPGHHTGDLLLAQVAGRLHGHLRAGDLLARLGGDEFAMLLEDSGRDEAVEVAGRLRAALDEPFALDGVTLYSRVSIGIAMFPDDSDDGPSLSTMLRKADIAMYRAKTSIGGHHVYSGNDEADGEDRLRTVEELRAAMTSDQLVLRYQPQVDLTTCAVHHVEALVRWNNPTRGLLYPGAFMGTVEESGLMPSLTRVVLALVLDQIADWQARGRQLTVAVNLPASSLVDSDLPRQVASMFAARGVSPRALQLEITEEFLLADPELARNILTRLRDGGVQISIDDFGTGDSSLSLLRDQPIDELKLDRAFVFPMARDARAAAVIASCIDLAHTLGLRVVAQGVESDVAFTRIQRLGCDLAQGFFICRPVPADELDRWLSSRSGADQSHDTPGSPDTAGPLRSVATG